MSREKRKKLTVNQNGSYHCNLGKSRLHEWVVSQVDIKGCSTIPETIKRLLQEAYERSMTNNQQQTT